MAQFQRGVTIGAEVESAAQLHALIEQASILPPAITDQIEANGVIATDYILVYSAAAGGLRKVQIGSLVFSSGDVIPTAAISVTGTGWLLCDGQQYLQSQYPALFSAVGSTYGAADAGYFRVPDLRGRGIAGLDSPVAETYADRLTATGTGHPGIDSRTLGAAGGVDRYTLTVGQLPPLALSFTSGGSPITNAGSGLASSGGSGMGLDSTGHITGTGSQAHPIAQPTLVLNFKIKT